MVVARAWFGARAVVVGARCAWWQCGLEVAPLGGAGTVHDLM